MDVADGGSGHTDHTSQHWLLDHFKKLRELKPIQWTVSLAASGLVLGISVALGTDLYHYVKGHAVTACEETVTAAASRLDRVVLFRENIDDERAVRRVRNVLEDRLPEKDFRFLETCRTAQTIAKARTIEPNTTAHGVSALRRELDATLALSIDGGGNSQITVHFWRRENDRESRSSERYDLNIPQDRDKLAKDVSGAIFRSDNDFVSASLDNLDSLVLLYSSQSPPTHSSQTTLNRELMNAYDRGRRMLT